MRSSKNLLILFASICLIISAQAQSPYKFLLKGDRSPYDSGVVIELREYRQIRAKVTLADSLIAALRAEAIQSMAIIQKQEESIVLQTSIIDRQSQALTAKDTTIQNLSRAFDELHKETTRPKNFLDRFLNFFGDRPLLTLAVGAVGGYLIAK